MHIRDKNLKDMMWQIDGCRINVARFILDWMEWNENNPLNPIDKINSKIVAAQIQSEKATTYVATPSGRVYILHTLFPEKAKRLGWESYALSAST